MPAKKLTDQNSNLKHTKKWEREKLSHTGNLGWNIV